MLRKKLAVVGTLVAYDDWWQVACAGANYKHLNPLEVGEGRAHRELAERYLITFRCVGGACDARMCSRDLTGPIFRIEAIGRPEGAPPGAPAAAAAGSFSTGFLFSKAELHDFKKTNRRCVQSRAYLAIQPKNTPTLRLRV